MCRSPDKKTKTGECSRRCGIFVQSAEKKEGNACEIKGVDLKAKYDAILNKCAPPEFRNHACGSATYGNDEHECIARVDYVRGCEDDPKKPIW